MATIKSFTDISQSKTLSKILPFESADMYYPYNGIETYPEVKNGLETNAAIPCWSFAALFGVLPNASILLKGFDKIYDLTNSGGEIARADNPIDACYELILKLHKLNLL